MLTTEQNSIRKAIHPNYYSINDPHPLPEDLKRIHVSKSQLQRARVCSTHTLVDRALHRTPLEHTMRGRSDARAFATLWRTQYKFDRNTINPYLSQLGNLSEMVHQQRREVWESPCMWYLT
jgi:hypothetical protein